MLSCLGKEEEALTRPQRARTSAIPGPKFQIYRQSVCVCTESWSLRFRHGTGFRLRGLQTIRPRRAFQDNSPSLDVVLHLRVSLTRAAGRLSLQFFVKLLR